MFLEATDPEPPDVEQLQDLVVEEETSRPRLSKDAPVFVLRGEDFWEFLAQRTRKDFAGEPGMGRHSSARASATELPMLRCIAEELELRRAASTCSK